jgi:cellulase (glycosyl hydrolase family 5)
MARIRSERERSTPRCTQCYWYAVNMLRTGFVCQALVAVYLLGCGGGDDGDGGLPPSFPGAPSTSDGSTPNTDTPPASPDVPGTTDMQAGSEGTDPNLDLDPTQPEQPAAPPAVTGGNGRLVNGACTLVCSSDLTDPDASGQTDGWGFESNRSCLTPESQLALANAPCDIPELLPLPALPPEIPPGGITRPEGNLSNGFFVSGGRLFDRFGNDFVMRGINHPVAWFQANALTWLDEIATTGANSVRLVWETDRGSTDVIRAAIEHAVELGMVPMVELHDVTGGTDVGDPARMAQYYVDDMRAILSEFEPYLLINIANEWGAFQTPDDTWVEAYRQAIAVLRDAGINHTLVIDGNNWGQKGESIVTQGATLLGADPQHNLLFSTHMYQDYENPQRMLDIMRGAQAAQLPLIVGEFGFQHGDRNGQPIPVPYTVMVDEAARIGMGYLPWSWTGNSADVGYLDMSVDGTASQLTGWGDDIINGQNGIRSTAKPASIFSAP